MEKEIPIYEVVMEDGEYFVDGQGIKKVAMVKAPANVARYMSFSDGIYSMKFASNEDRRILTGVLLVPNQKIYRNDEHGEYYMTFSAEAIEKVRDVFMKERNMHNVNIEHKTDNIEGIYMIETFLSDASRGIKPPDAFADYPDGTWFASYRVESDELWNDAVYNNKFTGFSIEGMLSVRRLRFTGDVREEQPIQEIEAFIEDALKQIEIIKNEV